MNFTDTLAEMLVLLFAMACGYPAERTLPAMILGSVSTGEALPDTPVVLGMLGVAAVFYGLELVFTLAVPPLLGGTPGQKGVWRFTLFFGNIGFIGYPVAVAFFGPEALFYAVLLVLPFNLMAFTLGPLLLSGVKRFSLRRMFSPAATAALAALVLALTRLRPPEAVGRAVEFVGSVTAPLSLLFVGSLLAGLPLGRMLASPRVWALSAVRLLAMPLALSLALRALGTEAPALSVAVVEMGMPAAMNGSMLCMEHGGDAECMAQTIFVTTLASIVSIPVVAALLL